MSLSALVLSDNRQHNLEPTVLVSPTQIGKENPEFLVAHSYTRYLGDLSGGQILGRITQKSLGLKNGDGLSFFSFPGVTNATLFKQLYRSRMNSIEVTEEERNGVLEEAVRAFEFNIQVRRRDGGWGESRNDFFLQLFFCV